LMTTESFDLTSETPEKQQELLKEYGLDASKRKVSRRVEVSTGSGKQTLYLGEVHPVGGSQFALLEKTGADGKTVLDETKVLLIPGHFKSAFDHDFTYWRNKKIFSMSAHEVTRFDLQGSYGPIHGKRVNGIWTLDAEGEKDLPGDIEAIDSLLTGSTYLVARKFISENKNDPKAKAALQGFSHVVDLRLTREKVETPKGESKTPHVEVASVQLTLYKKEKKGPKPTDPITSTVYATVSNLDPLFELDSYSKERVNKSLKELRLTKLISSMDRFGAKKVEFSGAALGGKSLILENSGGKWKLPHIKTDLAPEKISEKLQDTLERLSGNRIQEFFKGRDIPVGEENGLTFTLHGEKDAVQRQLLFWKKNNRLFGKDLLHRRDEAFLVDNSITDALPWSPDYFSKKNETNSLEKSDKTKE
ncbi:MAG: DUF4340 domain-containing protein, partial [Bdellovibrio sp.]|nr:DUF4340 domain-containing protein [Bdellovibrio sp.]